MLSNALLVMLALVRQIKLAVLVVRPAVWVNRVLVKMEPVTSVLPVSIVRVA